MLYFCVNFLKHNILYKNVTFKKGAKMTFISNHKLVQPQLILKKKVEPAEVEEKEEQNKQETTSTNNQPTIILDDSFKLKAYQVQEMTKLLQKGFTKTDIDKYFEWNSETKKYEMKPDIQITVKMFRRKINY